MKNLITFLDSINFKIEFSIFSSINCRNIHLSFYKLSKNYNTCLLLTVIVIAACCEGCFTAPKVVSLLNPSGKIKADVYIDSSGKLIYSICYKNKIVVAPSLLGITFNKQLLGEGVEIGRPVITEVNEKYPINGVHQMAVNHYREATIPIKQLSSGLLFKIEIKAFDDGIAFRYVVPNIGIGNVQGEASSFKIPTGSTVWYQENVYYYEGLYYESPLAKLGVKKFGPPLTYQTKNSIYVSITEATLYNYSGMSLQSDSLGVLHTAFVNDTSGWKVQDTIITPWRVAIITDGLNKLVNTDIIQNLNPAPDSSVHYADWIKPGRAVWSYFMHGNITTMALEKKYIDKASLLGFEYNMVDAGWESSWPNCMDSLKNLIEYAQKKQVKIWVWKSYASLKIDSTRSSFFKKMQATGVAGIKIDFIDKEGIEEIKFYAAALKDAAHYHLMLDFHGANKPTGINRTFPNELTREAIYGQEWTTYNPQGVLHNAITPFTRFLAGPADATPGVFDSKNAYGTSRVHQLALQIIFNSTLSCWPANPDIYLNSPALPLIKSIPTVWDETIVLSPSSIGKTVAFAKRKGSDWYIGIINAEEEKRFLLPLNFLGKGSFKAFIYQDDFTNSDQLLYSKTVHNSADSLVVLMKKAGGYVATFKSSEEKEIGLTISPQGGYLFAPMLVNMQTKNGLQIRYTLDKKEPSVHSNLFTKPFYVEKPTLIKASIFNTEKRLEASATAQFLNAPAPVLSTPEGQFIHNKTILIGTKNKVGTIHYTLNGLEPTKFSPIFEDSVVLTKSTLFKTKIVFKSGIGSVTAKAFYTKRVAAPAITNLQVTPGLKGNIYEGQWKYMPDFKKLTSLKTMLVSIPDLEQIKTNKEFYALQFNGYIKIITTGVYTFYLISDDGSQLFIDEEKIINNDGCHGDLEKSGEKALAPGLHKFRLNYFQNGSGQTLKVYIKEPATEKELIKSAMFFH